jgi:UDP:flavonoid glycosyltransferase YjiC (YdhE family)
MMRVLFATTRGAGHLGPLVPFAHACRAAGHPVMVAGPPSVAPLVARAGLSLLPVPEAPAATVDAAFAPVWSRTAAVDHVVQDLFVGLHARAALPGMLRAVAAWRPDVIVRESMEFASALAAEEHGVPVVRVGVHLESRVDGSGALEAIAAPALGIAAERLRASPLLTRAPASLNGPGEDVLRFRTDAAPRRRHRGRPLVYVSFGSEAPMSEHFPGVYRRAIDALASLPVRALVTIGDRRDPAELGPLPRLVRVERWVPQAEAMARAAAMVTHGGSGSTLAALAGGVPQAFVPLFVDGPRNAERVAAAGAGIVAEDIAAAVRELLDDPDYRRAAAGIAAEIRALPPVADAVGVIERSLTLGRGTGDPVVAD